MGRKLKGYFPSGGDDFFPPGICIFRAFVFFGEVKDPKIGTRKLRNYGNGSIEKKRADITVSVYIKWC